MYHSLVNAYKDRFVTKTASVSRAVKMYRRALLAFSGRGAPKVFHGTSPQNLKKIVSQGRMTPTQGTHGKGTYWWNQSRGNVGPRQDYMRQGAQPSSGIIANRKDLGAFKTPKDPSPGLTVDRQFMEIRPGEFKPPPKSYASATPEQLKTMRVGMKKQRLRPMDSAILERAEANTRMARGTTSEGAAPVIPTKKELNDLYRRKTKPPKYETLRANVGTPRENFVDSYEKLHGY